MKSYNLIEDISKLTNLKTSVVNKMILVGEYCICDYISNLDILDDDTLEVQLGIGTLSIQVIDDEINYQFKPNTRLEKHIVETVIDGENPLINAAKTSLEKKFFTTYKDLC